MEQGRDRLQHIIKQAASVHVLNAVYFLAMVVLTSFSLHMQSPSSLSDVSPALWHAGLILFITFLFKCLVHRYEKLQQQIPLEQFELLVTFCNVSATFMLLTSFDQGKTGSIALSLLNSFIPALLLVLITPLTWRKPKDVKFYGFFGFLEWSLIFIVLSWSMYMFVELVNQKAWLSLSTNMIVLTGPLFLGWMRRRYVDLVLQRMHEDIYLDPLTKVPNRKAYYDFYDAWRMKVSQNEAEKNGLLVLLCDVDHFKSYNDHYGHDVGDSCLRKIAEWLIQLKLSIPHAEVFRYGGEEFVILCPANHDDIHQMMSKDMLAQWISGDVRLPIKHERSPFGEVTLSGCATHVNNKFIYTNNALGVIGLVDHQLYKAKERRAILVVDSEPKN